MNKKRERSYKKSGSKTNIDPSIDVEKRALQKKRELDKSAREARRFMKDQYRFDPDNPPHMMFMAGSLVWRLNPWSKPKDSRTFLLTLSFKNPVSIDLIEAKIKEAFGGIENENK